MRKGLLGLIFGGSALIATADHRQVTDIEVPGDHFSLEGALELFKRSKSPEEFERLLNVPDSKVNNLDLNGDNRTDYIRVIDRYNGNVHAFIMQAVISERELQDVAVIELEKNGNGEATLQIVGDADIYGVETIIEPTQEVRVYAGTTTTRTVVNVWAWPVVQYVYDPYYSVWISPWGWYSRPVWYYPWRPVTYVVYRPYWDSYRPYYARCNYHRNVYAQRIYVPVRTTSVVVYNRHRDDIVRSRNTRGRDYDRDGYYRGEERNRNRPQDVRVRSYDNSRDYTTGRTRSEDSRDRTTRSEQENVVRERSFDRSNQESTDRQRSNSVPNVKQRSESNSQPNFSRPRSEQQNSRPQVEVNRGQSRENRSYEASPRSRSSESQSRPGIERSASPGRQSQATPRVSESRPSHGNDRAPSNSGQSSGSKKRGRD